MKKHFYLLFAVAFLLFSCEKEYEKYNKSLPSFGSDALIGETTPLSNTIGANVEGIYTVTGGNELFGDNVVFKYINGSVSIFGEKDGIYAVLEAGKIDSIIVLEGYWRQANTGKTDLCRFIIKSDAGGKQILTGTDLTHLNFSGAYIRDGGIHDFKVSISKFLKPESERKKMAVMAHRAGGRTSDIMHVSENSVEMVLYTEHFGSQGIEIDIQLTKDSIPVVFHDAKLDIRLLKKTPIMGSISDYTYEQLSSLVRLYHGEKLPSLEDMLTAAVEKTQLKYVWLDIKEPSAMIRTHPIQEKAMQRAKDLGRDIFILQGLPSDAMVDAFMQIDGYKDILSLCELTLDDVEKTGAKVWAPRWTRGSQASSIQSLHSQNPPKYAFVWTLDGNDYLKEFITTTDFDGILTNYPTIASFYYYINNAQDF